MAVVCRPLEGPDAIQPQDSPELAPQSWSCKLPPATTARASSNFSNRESSCASLLTAKLTPPSSGPDRLPLLPLDAKLALDCRWQRKQQQPQVSPKWDMQPRKRWASAAITATRRGLKRQRVEVDCTCANIFNCDDKQAATASVGSPRSLQFALPNLTSTDTLRVLHTMHTVPSELRHLNGSCLLNCDDKVQQVFGWRHLMCHEEQNEASSSRVVWKSAKALELPMRSLARQIWQLKKAREVLYTVNKLTRVVRSTKRHSGRRRTRDQIWLECYLDDGLQVCVARKELRHFTQFHAPDSSATECQGYLVRPVFAQAINPRILGCSVQCLRAVDAKSCNGASVLKWQLLQDLPRSTLQWEEDYVYDLVAAPQVLMDSIFAQTIN